MELTAEEIRLREAREGVRWRQWGPYLSERQWGTVREDYSDDGDAWSYFTHDQARSRAYRWGEDGMAGVSDDKGLVCLGLALWNGNDPILKERLFGLTNAEGNHGEDVKEYYFYVDNTPTHSWMRWRYKYPQAAYPYDDLVATNAERGYGDQEYELIDTGVFDDDRLLRRRGRLREGEPDRSRRAHHGAQPRRRRRSDRPACRRSGSATRGRGAGAARPSLTLVEGTAPCDPCGPRPGRGRVLAARCPTASTLLFCENETNNERLFGHAERVAVREGRHRRRRRARRPRGGQRPRAGPRSAARLRAVVPARGEVVARRCGSTRRRRRAAPTPSPTRTPCWRNGSPTPTSSTRRSRRPRWTRTPPTVHAPGARRHAVEQAALLLRPRPLAARALGAPAARAGATGTRNAAVVPHAQRRHHLDARQVGVPLVRRVGPRVPHGGARDGRPRLRQGPARPHAVRRRTCTRPARSRRTSGTSATSTRPCTPGRCRWSTASSGRWPRPTATGSPGADDVDFLAEAFGKLLLNFTWWVNRKDPSGQNVFQGGFLGLDNIGVFDRSKGDPVRRHARAVRRHRVDGVLQPEHDRARDGARRARPGVRGLHREVRAPLVPDRDGDGPARRAPGRDVGRGGRLLLRRPAPPRRHRAGASRCGRWSGCCRCARRRSSRRRRSSGSLRSWTRSAHYLDRNGDLLGGIADPRRARRRRATAARPRRRDGSCGASSTRMLDEDRFLGPHGIRSVSKWHEEHPYVLDLDGQDVRRLLRARRVRPPACSAATRTGAARCGSRSTCCWCAHCCSSTSTTATRSASSARPARATR